MSDPAKTEQLKTEAEIQQLMEVFTQIFNRDCPRLRSICTSHVPAIEVTAVLEQVWLEGLRFIRNHGREMSQKEVDTLTEHRAIDRWRQLERESRLVQELEANVKEANPSEDRETIIVVRQIARAVLQRLEVKDALIFSLCILRGQSASQAGSVVGLTPEAVRKRISRTIKPTLKAVARDYGYELSQGA